MPKPTTTEPKKTRSRTSASLAASAYARLERLSADEQEELTRSPNEIRSKYEAKRLKVLDGLAPEVRTLTMRLLGRADEEF